MGIKSLRTALGNLDISLEKANVFGYLNTATPTETTLADTYYTIEGTFTNPILDLFTADATGITYIGTETKTFKVIISVSALSDTSNTTVNIGVAKNGVVETGCSSDRLLKLTSDIGAWMCQCELTLETGDLVTLKVKSDKAGAEITFNQIQANIFPTTHFKE